MVRGKKNNNSRTPRRTSTRKKMRSMKGQYYDEHFNEFTAETEITTGGVSTLENSTPSIGKDLDTTVDIVDRITSNDTGLSESEQTGIQNSPSSVVIEEESNELLSDTGLSDELEQPCLQKSPPSIVEGDTEEPNQPLGDTELLDESEQPGLGNSLPSAEEADLEEPNQFLSNLYELHYMQMQNCHFQHSLVESACFNKNDSVALSGKDNAPTKSKDGDDDMKTDECSEITWKLNQKTHECDLLSKQLFELVHEKKILSDRVNHLENEEGYRSEVVRLERLVEEKEVTLQNLKDVAEVKGREVENYIKIKKDHESKIFWLEKVIEERDRDLEDVREDNKSFKSQLKSFEEVVW